jgi:hypothetical protein
LNGLQQADAVFYNGHSRDGGGPDFAPPRLTENGHVDYTWYEKNQPGIRPVMKRLDNDAKVKLLGLFSCSSTKHFDDKLRAAKPGLALISSPKLLYYADANKNMFAALSALLRQECEADFHKALRSQAEVGNTHLTGFF